MLQLCSSSAALASEVFYSQEQKLNATQAKELVIAVKNTLLNNYLQPQKSQQFATEIDFKLYSGHYRKSWNTTELIIDINELITRYLSDSSVELIQAKSQLSQGQIRHEQDDTGLSYLAFIGDFDHSQAAEQIVHYHRQIAQAKQIIIDLKQVQSLGLTGFKALSQIFSLNTTRLGKLTLVEPISSASSVNMAKLKTTKINAELTEPLTTAAPQQVIILHSAFVAGLWELFSVNMRRQHKATIVGEDSMGVVELTTEKVMPFGLILTLPYAQIAPTNESNSWQDTGINADVYGHNTQALTIALELLQANSTRP